VIDVLLEAIRSGAVSSAHDCSDGGLAVALAECCIANPESQIGAEVDLSGWGDLPDRAILFGETQGRIVLSSGSPEKILAIAAAAGVPCVQIGRVRRSSNALEIRLPNKSLRGPLSTLSRAYHKTIPTIMSRTPEHTKFDELTPVAAH